MAATKINSSEKGGRYEWEICRKLSFWLCGQKRRDLFAPSSGSGSVATRTPEYARAWGGDVFAISPEGFKLTELYTIELKHTKSIEAHRWLRDSYNPKNQLNTFWQQALRQTVRGRRPLLIFRQNRCPDQLVFQLHWDWKVLACIDQYVHIKAANGERQLIITPLDKLLALPFDKFVDIVNGRRAQLNL